MTIDEGYSNIWGPARNYDISRGLVFLRQRDRRFALSKIIAASSDYSAHGKPHRTIGSADSRFTDVGRFLAA
jgi:hypothetical protein